MSETISTVEETVVNGDVTTTIVETKTVEIFFFDNFIRG